MDQLPRLGKRELICLLLLTCSYVVCVWRGFLFLWVLGMGYVILLWHSLSLPLIIFHFFLVAFDPIAIDPILFKLAFNWDMHDIFNEFKFQSDWTTNCCGVSWH